MVSQWMNLILAIFTISCLQKGFTKIDKADKMKKLVQKMKTQKLERNLQQIAENKRFGN